MMTVNELLVLMRAVRERISGLEGLRDKTSVKERWYSAGTESKVIEPQYDVKLVDAKISALRTWLFKADAAIKQTNARTEVNITADVDQLLAPLS